MQTRFGHELDPLSTQKKQALPQDYLKLLAELIQNNFNEGIEVAKTFCPELEVSAYGQIFYNEIVLSLTFGSKQEISATTLFASVDYDPKASLPTLEDLLSYAVDALGDVVSVLFDKENPQKIKMCLSETWAEIDGAPIEWSEVQIKGKKVYLKMDRSNPKLDQMADDFLLKNDPELALHEEQEQKQTEALFVRGPKKKDMH